MKTIPFWTDAYPRPAQLPVSTELPDSVDVAIVGGGYTGLSAALELAKSGAAVAVFERHTIGWGASSRNGGMATPGIKQSLETIIRWFGPELGLEFWQASLDAIDLIDELVRTEDIDCDWRRDGHLYVASKPSHFEAMRRKADWYQQLCGHKVRVVPPPQMREEIGSDAFFGGLCDDFSGGLQPAKYVFGLAQAAARRGARLYEQAEVRAIDRKGQGFWVDTLYGKVEAGEVIIATNGYTDRLIPALKPKIFPVGSYIIVTEPLPEDLQRQLSPKGRMFYNSLNFINYFRLTPDGRMLWGGRNDLSTELDLNKSAGILHRQMCAVFPELRSYPPAYSWSGQLGLTWDLMPHIGRVDGVHYALGYGGHGLSIATYLGREIGQLLAGAKSRSPFTEIRHPTHFFYRNRPWFLPFAAQYYRLLDRIR